MLIVGTEWLIDASNCDAEALRDTGRLGAIFERAVAELSLHTVGEAHWHKFPAPGGVTGLALLSESHLACHTYPEFGAATFNLYCCRARPRWNWEEVLREMLGADAVVTVRVVERRAATTPAADDGLRAAGLRPEGVRRQRGEAGSRGGRPL
jgi:S-adenosylmethionine decarboxylase